MESLQQYSFEVEENMVYQVSTDKLGAPLQWNGGTLQPETITEIFEEWLNSLPDLAVPEVAGGGYQPASGEGLFSPGSLAGSPRCRESSSCLWSARRDWCCLPCCLS